MSPVARPAIFLIPSFFTEEGSWANLLSVIYSMCSPGQDPLSPCPLGQEGFCRDQHRSAAPFPTRPRAAAGGGSTLPRLFLTQFCKTGFW